MKKKYLMASLVATILLVVSVRAFAPYPKHLDNFYRDVSRAQFDKADTIEELQEALKYVVYETRKVIEEGRKEDPNIPAEIILQNAMRYISAAYTEREREIKGFRFCSY